MQSTVDTPAVVKAMVDRAQERGWAAVRIKGAPEFERQAWIAATARGIKAVGYQPTDLDRAAANEERERLAREGGDRGALSGGIITRESQREHAVGDRTNPSTPESPIATVDPLAGPSIARPLTAFLEQRGDAPQDVEAVVLAASGLVRGERVYVGRLVDHGADRYKFDPKNDQNYYVKLQTPDGEKTVWGVDLKRAITEGDIKTGSNVVLEYRGMQPVTVKTKDYDAAGRVVGTHEVEARRNTWFVADLDQLRGLADRAPVAALERQSGAGRSSAELTAAVSAMPTVDKATPTAATLTRRAKPALVQEPKARDARVLALLEAAFESRNVPAALRDHLRNAVSKGLSERKARGQVSRVKVYDPSAARQVPRAVIPPQQQRDAQERSR